MTSIELMMAEHQNILKLNSSMVAECENILENKELDTSVFYDFIDIVRNYADAHHHGKEEKFLFKAMEEHLGEMGVNLVRHGMLVEHDLGRLFIMNLDSALKEYDENSSTSSKLAILANTKGYADLLERHIGKEDELIYPYAEKQLAEEIKIKVNTDAMEYEKDNQNVATEYEEKLNKLFAKLEN